MLQFPVFVIAYISGCLLRVCSVSVLDQLLFRVERIRDFIALGLTSLPLFCFLSFCFFFLRSTSSWWCIRTSTPFVKILRERVRDFLPLCQAVTKPQMIIIFPLLYCYMTFEVKFTMNIFVLLSKSRLRWKMD